MTDHETLSGGAHHPDAHDWVLRVSESGGFVNDTDEPKDPTLGCLYWQHRWAATAVALTDALSKLDPPKRRATSLSPPQFGLLCDWGHRLKEAWGHQPYLVGSVARAEREWRDVDVRLILPDDEYERLVDRGGLRLRALNLSHSLWGKEVTGLPIDFQFQSGAEAEEEIGPMNPIGVKPSARWAQRAEQSDTPFEWRKVYGEATASDEGGAR